MDERKRNALIVLGVIVVLIISLGLLIGLYEKNYTQWKPPMATYGEKGRKATFLLDRTIISNNGSISYCKQFSLEPHLRHKLHAIRFQALPENRRIIDHIILWACPSANLLDKGTFVLEDPRNVGCDSVVYHWGPGAGDLTFPEKAGFPLDHSVGYNKHFLVQIRYSYPSNITEPISDSSGVSLDVISVLREFDGGLFPVGTSNITIPPSTASVSVEGGCNPAATNALLKSTPITVFSSGLHGHLLTRKIWVTQTRNGVQIGEIGRDDNYRFSYQQLIPVDAIIQPGDDIKVHCIYDSTSVTNTTTTGGSKINQEQCLSYMGYYPAFSTPNYCVDNYSRS